MKASATLRVVNSLGLHARAAAKLVRLASRFESHIELRRDAQAVDAKSVMGVLLLCCEKDASLDVVADGQDAQRAVDEIEALFAAGFGE